MSRNRVHQAIPPGYVHPAYPYPPQQQRHPPNEWDLLAQRIIHSVSQQLQAAQAHSDARINRIETTLQRLTTEVLNARQEARSHVPEIAEVLKTSHVLSMARITRFENILGMGADMKNENTLLDKLNRMIFAIEELQEQVKDPEANLPLYPVHCDVATSPVKQTYSDTAVPPRTPSPGPPSFSEDPNISLRSATSISTSEDGPSLSAESTLVDESSNLDKASPPDDQIFVSAAPKAFFAAASPVSRPLVPADWQNQDPSPPPFTFNHDRSPKGMQPFSALRHQPPPSEGTIASLRHLLEGSSPVSPRPSLSPPQSPRQIAPLVRTPLPPDTPTRARQSSIGADAILTSTPRRFGSHTAQDEEPRSPFNDSSHAVRVASPRRSRSRTVEDRVPKSPSDESFREEQSVLNIIDPPYSDGMRALSKPPVPQTEDVVAVPSSVTPSPLLAPQQAKTSPPHLKISIPSTSGTAPNPADLFDAFMSPLSATPSELSPSPSPPAGPSSLPQVATAAASHMKTSGLRLATQTRLAESSHVPISDSDARGKKRKLKTHAHEKNSAQQPPRKRGRPRKTPALVGVKQEKMNAQAIVRWPQMIKDPEHAGMMVGCDQEKCERWFHYSCLGLVPDDSTLEGDFYCPFCVAHQPGPLSPGNNHCARPDCPMGTDGLFEPVGVYGHYTKLDSVHGRIPQWLVLWKDYPFTEATWEPVAPKEMIEEFGRKARVEGLNPDGDDCVILAEAVRSGVQNPYA